MSLRLNTYRQMLITRVQIFSCITQSALYGFDSSPNTHWQAFLTPKTGTDAPKKHNFDNQKRNGRSGKVLQCNVQEWWLNSAQKRGQSAGRSVVSLHDFFWRISRS